MKRNTFFARFYLTSSQLAGHGFGIVCEQYFTTKQEYVFEYPKGKSVTVSQQLTTGPGSFQPGVIDTSNGCVFAITDIIGPGTPKGVFFVNFQVDETPGQLFKITNTAISFNLGEKQFTNHNLEITAYAIGVVDDIGQINGKQGIDNVRWIVGTHFKDPHRSLTSGQFMTGKWISGSAFDRPTFLSSNEAIEDILFKEVYSESTPTESESDCCVANANSLALVAAASLVASNNATSPLLIRQLEHAVKSEFDATSTISALRSMRQFGTLSNVAGKALDNTIPKNNDVVIIKNGPQE